MEDTFHSHPVCVPSHSTKIDMSNKAQVVGIIASTIGTKFIRKWYVDIISLGPLTGAQLNMAYMYHHSVVETVCVVCKLHKSLDLCVYVMFVCIVY